MSSTITFSPFRRALAGLCMAAAALLPTMAQAAPAALKPVTEAEAAVLFRDGERGPALLDAGLPEALIIASGLLKQGQEPRLVMARGEDA